jgi:hypothetical protein
MAAAPEPGSLVVHTMVSKVFIGESIALNQLTMKMQCGVGQWKADRAITQYIGLREREDYAVDRAIMVEGRDHVNKDTHMILRVTFSALGVAHFGRYYQDSSLQFRQKLYKKSYYGNIDWGVWHLLGDLPLSLNDEQGNTLVSSEYLEIQ